MTHEVSFPNLGLEFTLNPIAIEIGSFSIYWYGIIIAIGFLLAIAYALKSSKSFNLSSDAVFDCSFIGLIAGVIGARLYYVIFYPGDKYWNNPLEIFNIKDGGLGIYGGIILGLLAGFLVAKRKKISTLAVLDVGCLSFLIGQGVGRWGNFINQEAFGDATNLPWGMSSDATELIVPGANVHPCFLYESILCFLGFILLHIFSRKFRQYDGQVALLYAVWYGLSRFFIEGLRTDSLMIPYINIKVSQAVAMASVLIAIALLIALRNRTNLTGCGSQKIIELNGIIIGNIPETKTKVKTEKNIESSIFANENNAENTETISENSQIKEEKLTSKIIDGKQISSIIKNELKAEVTNLKANNISACLAVVIVGDNSASKVYVKNKKLACADCGIESKEFALPENTSQKELLDLILELNEDASVNGILVQLPLPKHLNEEDVIATISPLKDVDAFHENNVGRIMIGNYNFLPCTPAGIMELIKSTGIEVETKHCVVIGRSNIVGKPMAMLLLRQNGTVTICHSKTKNLSEICKNADILVAAVGRAKFVTANMVKEGAVVIDVGMNIDENGKLCGDVDFDEVSKIASYITPVPGGVGPMTIAMLLKNTITATKIQNGLLYE